MPITDHIIEAGDYQQQGILVSELDVQPAMDADALQERFDALGLLIKDKHNALITELVNAFTAAEITNATLAPINNANATTVAGQLAYLLWYAQQINQTVLNNMQIGDGTLNDAKLSNNTADIKQRFLAHTTATSAQHTVAQLPTGTTATTVALGNHTHSYAPTTHAHATSDIATGTMDIARLPVGTTSVTVSRGDHIHDDRYYTEAEVNTELGKKASSSHTHGTGDITSGELNADRLPSLAISKISGLQTALNTCMTAIDGHRFTVWWDGSKFQFTVDGVVTQTFSQTNHNHDGSYAYASHDHGNGYVKTWGGVQNYTVVYTSGGDPGGSEGVIWLKGIT